MKIDLTKGKPMYIDASYTTSLEFDLSELDIDWSEVEQLWCKYGVLTILMKDETEHILDYSTDGETDYKWPVTLTIYDEDYHELYSE